MTQPQLTVVIPSVNGWSDLDGCLSALELVQATVRLEVLVPERCGAVVRGSAAEKYPWATIIPVSPETTIPEMRAMAFDRASAASVAVIEDHVFVPPEWGSDLLRARDSAQVIGGGVVNLATERLVDWAAFLCEYSHMLPPLPTGEHPWITGNNTVYARELLERHRVATHAGRWENHLHEAIRANGIPLMFRPDIVAGHKKHYSIGEYFSQRYLYARSHAGARASEGGIARRVGFALGSLALPPVLLWRTVSRSFQKEVPKSLVWRCMPLTVIFVLAWGLGDIVGSWCGAGDSLSKVC